MLQVLAICPSPLTFLFAIFFSFIYIRMIRFQRLVDQSIYHAIHPMTSAERLSPFVLLSLRVAQTGKPRNRLRGGFGYLGLLGLVVMSTELSVRLLMSSAS